jgi:hypothetical protein
VLGLQKQGDQFQGAQEEHLVACLTGPDREGDRQVSLSAAIEMPP